jgi:prepilin-type N-terminal cleavage/methylation domain-containing protein
MQKSKKGFTLVELLVVIGILAVLTAAVVVVLNPAELLAQARDTQRLADFDAMKNAVALYLVATTTPVFTAGPFSTSGTNGYSLGVATENTSYAITGAGWFQVDFSTMANPSSPISALPRDPVTSATLHYVYKGDNTNKTFEVNTELESSKYTTNKELNDGGDSTTIYEVGTDPGLNL